MTIASGPLEIARVRVKNGVELLDRHRSDWRAAIDPKKLKLSSFQKCILGQLYGDYGDGKFELGIPFGESWQYGFDVSWMNDDVTHELLRQAWLEELGQGAA